MTIRKGTNIIIGQVPTDTSITSTGIYPVTGAAIYTALGLKANNSDVVHKSGDETIADKKTFTGSILQIQSDSNTTLRIQDPEADYTIAPDAQRSRSIDCIDKNGKILGNFQFVRQANGDQETQLLARNKTNGTQTSAYIRLGVKANGDQYAIAPEPAATNSTSETKIATTGWVNDATKSTNVVHKDTTETITGTKTFTGGADVSGVGTATITLGGIETTTGEQHYTDIVFGDTTPQRVCLIRGQKGTDERRSIGLAVVSTSGSNVGGLTVSCAADGTDLRCNLPANTYGTNFHGTADYAKWADLAECYKSDQKYSVGTLIKFGGEKDITIANDKCNGVISDKPGFLLDAELEDSQPIALVGKTPIRIIGKVKKFDKIVLSEIPGVGRVLQENEDNQVIARALENNDTFEEKLVMCVTKFNLD